MNEEINKLAAQPNLAPEVTRKPEVLYEEIETEKSRSPVQDDSDLEIQPNDESTEESKVVREPVVIIEDGDAENEEDPDRGPKNTG